MGHVDRRASLAAAAFLGASSACGRESGAIIACMCMTRGADKE
ncbi:hypothetical protein APY03_2919 [Variovorax sp. WDL1]|nr:hypothetical protein APY03_2919 [Variovorax sp. WDL1]